MNIDRRSFLIGATAVVAAAAAGPAIAKAIAPKLPPDCNAWAALVSKRFNTGRESRLPCRVHFRAEGEKIVMVVDRPLDFAADFNGYGRIELRNDFHGEKVLASLDVEQPITTGCTVRLT